MPDLCYHSIHCLSVVYQTSPFTVLNPWHDVSELHKIRRCTDFEVLKIRKGLSDTCTSAWLKSSTFLFQSNRAKNKKKMACLKLQRCSTGNPIRLYVYNVHICRALLPGQPKTNSPRQGPTGH